MMMMMNPTHTSATSSTNLPSSSWSVIARQELVLKFLCVAFVSACLLTASRYGGDDDHHRNYSITTTTTTNHTHNADSDAVNCQTFSLTLRATTIHLEEEDNRKNRRITLTTRLLNGRYPGPVLRVRPGECWFVDFHNQLPPVATPHDRNVSSSSSHFRNNQLSAPDETNLHFHGLHVSGEIPSDDVTAAVGPGQRHVYRLDVPDRHMPGTHWVHAHRHGSSALHVAGGAIAAVVIVDDDDDHRLPPPPPPAAVARAPEVLFVAHPLDPTELTRVADAAGDRLVRVRDETDFHNNNNNNSSSDDDGVIVTVNGGIRPEIPIVAGRWTRMRIVWAAWRKGDLDWRIGNGCETVLLAKDGIYIRDFPRDVTDTALPLLPGARADVLVRCPEHGVVHDVHGPKGRVIAKLVITTASSSDDDDDDTNDDDDTLQPWTPVYPAYLRDLRHTVASSGCTCPTVLTGRTVNGRSYRVEDVSHQSYLGAVVERHLVTGHHPYHQHVYPFQVISGLGAEDDENDEDDRGNVFYRVGDYHDTVTGTGVIRYQPLEFTGKIMVHCHRLIHEDEGMMSMEWVHGSDHEGAAKCTCADEESGTTM